MIRRINHGAQHQSLRLYLGLCVHLLCFYFLLFRDWSQIRPLQDSFWVITILNSRPLCTYCAILLLSILNCLAKGFPYWHVWVITGIIQCHILKCVPFLYSDLMVKRHGPIILEKGSSTTRIWIYMCTLCVRFLYERGPSGNQKDSIMFE